MRYDEYHVGQRVRTTKPLNIGERGELPAGVEGTVEAIWPNPPWPQYPNGGAKRHKGWPINVKLDGEPDDRMYHFSGLRGYPLATDEIEPL